ncbi:hypothetical protein Pst134EB_016438 [Puccinia striiformis f. sp. tritici]|nr:hypothetical protein Pst134EB_016438 [Puccinia striiformis f. sp. tritici]
MTSIIESTAAEPPSTLVLVKLHHTATLQLQEERRLLSKERRADRERISLIEEIAEGPAFTGPFQEIEPFLKWILSLQIFFSTKGVVHDDDKIYVAGGLLQHINLLDFYASKGVSYIGRSWNEFKSRLFEVALPQRWCTTLKTKLRKLTLGPSESFITYSGCAQTLQSLINFDEKSDVSTAKIEPSAGFTQLSDFDLAEYVVSGLSEELNAEVVKFALLDATPFIYSVFEKRVACFDEVTIRKPIPRSQRTASSGRPTSPSSPDPVVWRVHAFLNWQGQCHHCKTTCGSAPGTCTIPLSKRWVEIPASFQTPPRPDNYQQPKAHGPSPTTAGKPTHPPAGRPPHRSASLAAIDEDLTSAAAPLESDHLNVIGAIDMGQHLFEAAIFEDSLPPDLTTSDWATIATKSSPYRQMM